LTFQIDDNNTIFLEKHATNKTNFRIFPFFGSLNSAVLAFKPLGGNRGLHLARY
jgi:hypothetical protein